MTKIGLTTFENFQKNEHYLYGKSYIKLKVKGKGINRIFYAKDKEFNSKYIPPNEVIINNIRKSYVYYEYEFKNESNNVILIWSKPCNNLHTAFYGCSNITNVDFSNFNSSCLEHIGGLFQYCSSLTDVNFTNFNTENVRYMDSMFSGCSSISSLDISNFNTSSVVDMKYMFKNCQNLHYLNLKNFEQRNNFNYTDIFRGIPNNIIVCINKLKARDLYQLIKNLGDSYFDCSDDWFIRNNIFNYSYISLKVKGKGINRIFYARDMEEWCSKFMSPNEVLINIMSVIL